MSEKESGLYFLLVSVHGLIRGHDLELGRDADTGGQTLYVVELARALGEREDVARVDLVTRRIVDPAVSENYAQVEEALSDKVRIVRVDAGPEEYLPKEALWDHLDTFTDNLTRWLGEQPRRPDVVHSHYADAGYVGVRLANLLAVPLVHTGHSLGRDKRKRLLAKGLSGEAIESTYNMSRRVAAEEELLANADLVITSTHNEIEEQYGFVDNGKNGNLAFAMAAAASLTPNGEQSVYAGARDAAAMTSFYTTTFMLHGHTGGGIGEIWRSAAMGLLALVIVVVTVTGLVAGVLLRGARFATRPPIHGPGREAS